MADSVVSQVNELPMVLQVRHLQDVLGISRPEAYKLVHTRGFPTVRLGRAIRVPREAFMRWLDEQAGGQANGHA